MAEPTVDAPAGGLANCRRPCFAASLRRIGDRYPFSQTQPGAPVLSIFAYGDRQHRDRYGVEFPLQIRCGGECPALDMARRKAEA
jgi:hypothetical protein